MHDMKVYERMLAADGFAFFTPVHWYSVTSRIKQMMDRLVCVNLTMTSDQALEIYGDREKSKNAELTRALDQARKHDHLMKNHLVGKVAAIFVHGDDGADEPERFPMPLSFPSKNMMVAKQLGEPTTRQAVDSLKWTLRWKGIYCPEDLVVGMTVNRGLSYSESNDAINHNEKFFQAGRQLMRRLADKIAQLQTGMGIEPI